MLGMNKRTQVEPDKSPHSDGSNSTPENETTGVAPSSPQKDSPFGGILLDLQSRKMVSQVASGITKTSFILSVALAGSIAVNGYLVWKVANLEPRYFASTDDGRIIPLIPLDEPTLSVADVIDFSQKATRRSMTLDFLNYRSQLEDSRHYFTDAGFDSFLGTMSESGILDSIRNGRFNMSASTDTGVLAQQGVLNGRRVYIINFPLTLKLSGQTTDRPDQRFMATVRVERISTAIDAQGVAITSIVTEPR